MESKAFTFKSTTTKMTAVAVVLLMVACTFAALSFESDADTAISVQDGRGETLTLDAPAEKVIVTGVGISSTIIQIGCLDKVVVADTYTKNSKEEAVKPIQDKIASGDIRANGNTYGSGRDAFIADCLYVVDNGLFDKEKDLVILTTGKSYATPIIDTLTEKGFKNIAVWYEIKTYGNLVDYVNAVSMLLTGEKGDMAEQAANLTNHIDETLEANGITEDKKVNAFFVRYSNGFQVGNEGSLAQSMIIAAGGNAFTTDPAYAGSNTYPAVIPEVWEKGGDGTVVFADITIWKNADNLATLKSYLPDDAKIVNMESLWNNYSIDSMKGLQAMASAMYPNLFSSEEVPDDSQTDDKDSTMTYVAIAIVVIVVIAAACYFVMNNKKKNQ